MSTPSPTDNTITIGSLSWTPAQPSIIDAVRLHNLAMDPHAPYLLVFAVLLGVSHPERPWGLPTWGGGVEDYAAKVANALEEAGGSLVQIRDVGSTLLQQQMKRVAAFVGGPTKEDVQDTAGFSEARQGARRSPGSRSRGAGGKRRSGAST